MLWAFDIGNTQTVVGLHDGTTWRATWRHATDARRTEDELAALLWALCQTHGLPFAAEGVVVASVVPPYDEAIRRLAEEHLHAPVRFLRNGAQVGVKVDYDPPHAVGADRIANAVGALAFLPPPLVVVDFGTATTLDVVDREGTYVGGAILPGIHVSLEALVGRTSKLPAIAIEAPQTAIGKTTVHSLQSGVVLGYACAIDGLIEQVVAELGGTARVVSTGGLGSAFTGLAKRIEAHYPELTLDGLRLSWPRLRDQSS